MNNAIDIVEIKDLSLELQTEVEHMLKCNIGILTIPGYNLMLEKKYIKIESWDKEYNVLVIKDK